MYVGLTYNHEQVHEYLSHDWTETYFIYRKKNGFCVHIVIRNTELHGRTVFSNSATEPFCAAQLNTRKKKTRAKIKPSYNLLFQLGPYSHFPDIVSAYNSPTTNITQSKMFSSHSEIKVGFYDTLPPSLAPMKTSFNKSRFFPSEEPLLPWRKPRPGLTIGPVCGPVGRVRRGQRGQWWLLQLLPVGWGAGKGLGHSKCWKPGPTLAWCWAYPRVWRRLGMANSIVAPWLNLYAKWVFARSSFM